MFDLISFASSMASTIIAFCIDKRLKNKIKSSVWRFITALALTVIIMVPLIWIIEYLTNNGWTYGIIK